MGTSAASSIPQTSPAFSLFPANLRFLRKRRGLNQEDISGLFNKKANTVGNWENGKSEPSIPELLVLSGYFGVNLEQLLRSELNAQHEQDERQLLLWPGFKDKLTEGAVPPKVGTRVTGSPSRPKPVETSDGELYNNEESENQHKPAATEGALDQPGGDALWFMLRELRTVQERLDRLQGVLDRSRPAQPADKSDH